MYQHKQLSLQIKKESVAPFLSSKNKYLTNTTKIILDTNREHQNPIFPATLSDSDGS